MASCSHCGSHFFLPSSGVSQQTSILSAKKTWWLFLLAITSLIGIILGFGYFSQKQSKPQPTYKPTAETVEISSANTALVSNEVDMKILNATQGQTIVGGIFWIFEVKNTSRATSGKVKVVVSLFDKGGKRIKEQSGWSQVASLKSGETTEVLVLISEPPTAYAKVKFSTYSKTQSSYENKQVQFAVADFKIDPVRNGYEIVGDVNNPFGYPIDFVKILVVGYDKSDKPIGLANHFATQNKLKAGESSGFKVNAGTFLTQKPEKWKVFAVAQLNTMKSL